MSEERITADEITRILNGVLPILGTPARAYAILLTAAGIVGHGSGRALEDIPKDIESLLPDVLSLVGLMGAANGSEKS